MHCEQNLREQREQLVSFITTTTGARRRLRSVRTPFNPSVEGNPYRLPISLHNSLTEALKPIRNREAAFRLAMLLGRFWSAPGRPTSFPIDRRALSKKDGLDLSEARIRGAISTLETLGFIERVDVKGKTHQVSCDGSLHRKPIIFRFGPEALEAFQTANARSRKARGKQRRPSQSLLPLRQLTSLAGHPARPLHVSILPPRQRTPFIPSRASLTPWTDSLKYPKNTSLTKSKILMGEEISSLDQAILRFTAARSSQKLGKIAI